MTRCYPVTTPRISNREMGVSAVYTTVSEVRFKKNPTGRRP